MRIEKVVWSSNKGSTWHRGVLIHPDRCDESSVLLDENFERVPGDPTFGKLSLTPGCWYELNRRQFVAVSEEVVAWLEYASADEPTGRRLSWNEIAQCKQISGPSEKQR